jgi:hypothetical protein
MATENAHRIALINFSAKEADVLTKAGLNAELGFLAKTEDRGPYYAVYSFARPLYEYDVYVYNGLLAEHVRRSYPNPKSLAHGIGTVIEPLTDFANPPSLRISLLGPDCPSGLVFGGVPFIHLDPADEGLSILKACENANVFRCAELEHAIKHLRSSIATPVHRYIRLEQPPKHPFNHFPLLVNRNGDLVGVYATIYHGAETRPVYVVLPQFRNNAETLVTILEVVAEAAPSLFPERPGKRAWLHTREFAFKEEIAIDEEIEAKTAELAAFGHAKRAERAGVAGPYECIRRILTATEDASEKSERLSTNVRLVLQFLGFEVVDIDEQIRGAIRKEDFWVRDGGFLAVTEVTATKHKNPKTKEYNDLLGRMTTIFKHRDLVPDTTNATGLLVLGYDIDTHPFKRPRAFTGGEEEIALAAKEHGIGLLSTVELYKIAVAVKDGELSRDRARELVKESGRIEYGGGDQSA